MPEQRQITFDDVKNFIKQITPNQDWLYIFLPYSLGDFFNVGSLSLAVQKRKNKSATVLIVNERLKNLGVTYENVANIIFLPPHIMAFVREYICATGDYEGDNYIYGHFRHLREGVYDWDESLNLLDRYKKDVFKIPMDTPYAKPVVPPLTDENIAELHEKYILDKDRTIILAPYAHTTKPLDIRFWMFLAMIFTTKGYHVYTNVDGFSEQPIPGTEPISTNFRELYYISDKVKCFIGSRVGIFEFLVFTQARCITINPFPSWLWDVSVLYPEFTNLTLYNAIDYMATFIETTQKDKVHAEIKLSHEYINSANICYSYEEILNRILNEVEKN